MSDTDDVLYDYVQTLLEDREKTPAERVANAMDPIEKQVRAEFGMKPTDSFGPIPPEWAHKVPPVQSTELIPGILMVTPELVDEVRVINFPAEPKPEPKRRWWHHLSEQGEAWRDWWTLPR